MNMSERFMMQLQVFCALCILMRVHNALIRCLPACLPTLHKCYIESAGPVRVTVLDSCATYSAPICMHCCRWCGSVNHLVAALHLHRSDCHAFRRIWPTRANSVPTCWSWG